jgi:hypothetical protein
LEKFSPISCFPCPFGRKLDEVRARKFLKRKIFCRFKPITFFQEFLGYATKEKAKNSLACGFSQEVVRFEFPPWLVV